MDITMRRSPTSEDFYAALEEIKVLHDRKQSDYGRAEAPFANVEKSADFGIEPWVGALVRGNDKMGRLQKAAQGGTLSNEGVEDSLMDMAVYALIALVEYRAMNESSYDPYQFDQTDDELAAEWLEKNRNFDGKPDGYDTPLNLLAPDCRWCQDMVKVGESIEFTNLSHTKFMEGEES